MIGELLEKLLPGGSITVAIIGFPPSGNGESPWRSYIGQQTLVEFVDLDVVDPGSPLAEQPTGVVLVARTFTDLRRAASVGTLLPAARHTIIGVEQSSPTYHSPLLLAAPPTWPAATIVQGRTGRDGEWAVRFSFATALPAGQVLAAIVQQKTPLQKSGLVARVALAGPGAAHWRPGDPGATLTTEEGPLGDPERISPADLVVRTVHATSGEWRDPRAAVIDRPRPDLRSWAYLAKPGVLSHARDVVSTLSTTDCIPPVDEHSVNPTGFLDTPAMGFAQLTQVGNCWNVVSEEIGRVPIHPSGAITDADVAKLRPLRGISVAWGRHTGPVEALRVLAGLAAAGVPLSSPPAPTWATPLGTELLSLMTRIDTAELHDNLRREEHSIRLRRAAMRTHSTQARWRSLATSAGLTTHASQVSVLLCTKRPRNLRFALAQVARQRYVHLEVVLVLHGTSSQLPEVRSATTNFPWQLTIVEVPADIVFGEALNRGAAVASGSFLAKWDDDDWYGPEFLSDLLMAAHYSGADLVGCFSNLTYLEQINLTVHRRGTGSEQPHLRVAGGTLTMDRNAFFAVGGFRPLARFVDTGLQRAVNAAGGTVYRTHGLGYMLHRRSSGHTWNESASHFLRKTSYQWRGFAPRPLVEADPFSPTPPEWEGAIRR